MKRLVWLVTMMFTVSAFSQTGNEKTISVEIQNVVVKGGTVYISVSLSEEAYKKRKPELKFPCEPAGNVVKAEITVPTGDCVISVYQDRNENGKMDNNLLGIPKEPVGITNWDGKGLPGSFDKLKVSITDKKQTIRITLHQL